MAQAINDGLIRGNDTANAPGMPLVLMYHGNPVRFRNIWIREIKELDGKRVGRTAN